MYEQNSRTSPRPSSSQSSQNKYHNKQKCQERSSQKNRSISEDSSYTSNSSQRREIRFFNKQMTQSDIQNEIQLRKQDKSKCIHCHKYFCKHKLEKHKRQCFRNKQISKTQRKPHKYYDSDDSSSENDYEKYQENTRNLVDRKKNQNYYHPRRNYRLSQSSSSEDEQQQFWREHHETNNRPMNVDFAIKICKTRLEGITIVQCCDGEGGRVIKRSVHNDLTGERKRISNHRYERHYKMHVIDTHQNHPVSSIARQNSQDLNSHPPIVQTQLLARVQQAIRRFTQSLNEIQMGLDSHNGLTKEELQNFERSPITQPFQHQDKCSICCSEYEEGQYIMTLKCIHYFHDECIEIWLRQNSLCPLCKTNQK